jgi:hypothetical protein
MTAQLPTGTLLDAIVCGNSCRMKNCAFSPSEKKKKYRWLFFFSAIIPKYRKVILPFHAYKGAKQNETKQNKK